MSRPRKQYDAKPLVEAIFELFADPQQASSQWGKVPVDRIRQRMPEYVGKEEQLQDVGIFFNVGPQGIDHGVNPVAQRVRLWNTALNKAVQFGPHMCAHNVLAPAYGHFEDHIETFRSVFTMFLEEARPARLAWLGQRYINVVKVPVDDQDVASYFSFYPSKLPPAPGTHRPLALAVQTASWQHGTAAVNLSFRSLEGNEAWYLLDVYARSSDQLPADPQALVTWQSRAHDAIAEAFELSITDKSRHQLFKERP